METSSKLIVEYDATDFFRQEVDQAKRLLGIHLEPHCEFYLVQLLAGHLHPMPSPSQWADEPLFVLRQKAQSATPSERAVLLKQLGDEALYKSGFFAESIERSLLDMTYYATMGGGAYQDLSRLLGAGSHGEALPSLYRKLATDFRVLVDVLNQVACHAQQQTKDDRFVLQLYDRYTRTKNQRVKKMLEGRGVVVPEISADVPLGH